MSVFRVDATIIASATGGSKEGPPVMTARVRCSVRTLLALLDHVNQFGGMVTWAFADSNEAWPLFWPAATAGADIPMESRSDSHLRSMRDEAVRCWDGALSEMTKKRDWLRMLGAHDCVADQLFLPFRGVDAVITIPNFVNEFLAATTEARLCPDLRVLGYRLIGQWLAGASGRQVVSRLGHYTGLDSSSKDWRWHEAELTGSVCGLDLAWTLQPPGIPEIVTNDGLGELLMSKPAWAS